ncbi:bifunctional 4-hydroxy-2-oxoglutarate aldolase/2-dehydro-3-deoxy-phosphogluconate aldolase [Rhodospirillaceae bacterium SYSU D60014]|uniref:bifunctional 4-hydroxy-2-oxoglutarate aldolase/2-dehydro-3-deoxy-phosphogluconate aldolase n=1 Tax=Virgifigura deserti TaxID=2268457 RepID=UPI000E667455
MTSTAATDGPDLGSLLASVGIVPVLTIERREDAVPLARALVEGGFPVLEVTLRTDAGLDAAAAIAAEVPSAVVGLGTVLTPADLDRARAVGALFAVSPGATPALLSAAADSGLPFLPGVATPSEMMQARAAGFTLLKYFPAEPSGGVAALRALRGPFPDLRFCPTGGIDEHSLRDYLALPNVVAVGGSWLAPAADIAAGAWSRITERARRAVQRTGA